MRKLLIISFFSLGFVATQAQTTDNQLWTAVQVEKEFIDHLTIALSAEARFDNDISRLRTIFSQIEAEWKFNKYLSTSLSYRYGGRQFEELSELTKAHRVTAYVTGKYKFKKFSIGNLNVNSFTISNRAGYYNQYLVDAPDDRITPQQYFPK